MTPIVKIPIMEPVTTCKACGSESRLYGVVDFTKNCNEPDVKVQLSGVPIYYYQCEECQFLFTRAFDDWGFEEYKAHIYNQNYEIFDPDYVEVRPKAIATDFQTLLEDYGGKIRCLDYGGGNGLMTEIMRAKGFDFTSWDPLYDAGVAEPDMAFDFVSAIEVAEHVPDPHVFFAAIAKHLSQTGVGVIATHSLEMANCQPYTQWWYVSPLNGHISIYANKTLDYLCGVNGLHVIHDEGWHIVYKEKTPLLRSCLSKIGRVLEQD
jgi:hypothetical protein